MTARIALPCFAALLLLSAGAFADGEPSWELAGGATEIALNKHVLGDFGVEIRATAADPSSEFHSEVFRVDGAFPTLRLTQASGQLEGHLSGGLGHRGSLTLSWKGGQVRLSDFELVPAAGDGLFDLVTREGFRPFFLDNAHAQFVPDSREFMFLNMDLRFSPEMAGRLSRPDIAGLAVGAAHVRTQRVGTDDGVVRGGMACTPDFTGTVDVALDVLDQLTEVDHDGSRVAMAPSARLENVGTADVPWYQAIAPSSPLGQHPFLYNTMYREADGAFHQIGAADLKHAFFSINSGCPCFGDNILYEGCGDTYGVGTNVNRFYLGPRDELTAATGDWTSLGSHFDAIPVDDTRDHGSSHPDGFEHRLTVTTADLSVPGASYFYSAWYIVKDDVDIFNGMGYRAVTPTFSGGDWTFPDAGSLVLGAAVDAWVDPLSPPAGTSSTLIDECVDVVAGDCDGHLKVAAKATLAPNGLYRYDYAVQNLDYDPQIDSFSIPLPAGIEVTNASFRDIDADAGNDWAPTITPAAITWDLPGGANSAMDWGTLYNFRFEANADSTDASATLGIYETRGATGLAAMVKAPSSSVFATSDLDVTLTGDGAGSVASAPVGIDCGSDCDEVYAQGASVTLSATADPGSRFVEWTEGGLPAGTDEDLELTLGSDRSLVAEFEACDKTLADISIDGVAEFEACGTLTTGSQFDVEATGDATLRAASAVVMPNGVSVETGGLLTVEIDPTL